MKTILVDCVHALVIKDGGLFEPMHELLETYPNKKIVLSNATDEEFEKFGLQCVPYEFFTLKRSPDKINLEYFELMLKHFNLSADQVVCFEHNLDAVKSAQSVGITTYYYDSDKKDLGELKKFLDENL